MRFSHLARTCATGVLASALVLVVPVASGPALAADTPGAMAAEVTRLVPEASPVDPRPSAQQRAPRFIDFRPPVRIRSQRAAADARAVRGATPRLRKFLAAYPDRARRKEAALAGDSLPGSCFRRLRIGVERIRPDAWAVVSQRLVNRCGFDASQRVVLKAARHGKGRVVARLGSGGAPDCTALSAAGVPEGLVRGC